MIDSGRPKHSFSGDAGYCYYKKTTRGVVIEWSGNEVISVDCEHQICRYSDDCPIYKRHPVGFVQSYPKTPSTTQKE